MILLSYGVTKSGSTLAFEIAKGILISNGFPQTKLPAYVAPGRINFLPDRALVERRRIELLVSSVADHQRIAVKTHSFLNPALVPYLEELIQGGSLFVNAVYRDPRDVCLSLVDAGGQARRTGRLQFSRIVTLDDAIENVAQQLETLRIWGSIQGVSLYEYDELAFETDKTIERMARGLQLVPKKHAVKRRLSRVFTQKNKARPNRHEDEMTPEQNRRCLDRFGGFIEEVIVNKNFAWFSRHAMPGRNTPASRLSCPAKAV